ncbi:hypothetical protein ARHIZOSPH14_19080 [Agromyces rhizosphaerae]|uniref:Uncharacterized protein n=1 Tax=Agromyces rhizosphaerae TaxID=88374 RepID=A0A9W6CX74_9MICO|nr:hypothetical protein ARHIZOSPH14_19080 [Agromyces rhizosphaerae]
MPAIAVAVSAPAYAASGGSGAPTRPVVVSAACGSRNTGTFRIDVGTFAAGEQIQITLTHTGSGSFSATPQFTHTGSGNGPYVITGTGADFDGIIDVAFSLGQNGTGTVSIVVAGQNGLTLTGDLTSAITKRRDGNSNNYMCSTA